MRAQTHNSDLHEGAIEKWSLRNDKVGANTAGHCLLNGTQLLFGQVQSLVQLVQVTPATKIIKIDTSLVK